MFIVYLEQDGGCDYTIGCGNKIIALKSLIKKDAILEVKSLVAGDWDDEEERFMPYWDEIDRATLYEISEKIILPVDDWIKENENFIKEFENAKKEEEEKQLLKKLKKKYDK